MYPVYRPTPNPQGGEKKKRWGHCAARRHNDPIFSSLPFPEFGEGCDKVA